MMRLVDADLFNESLKQAQSECRRKEGGNFLFGFLSKVRANLEKMPTVDAVPVVRCKDCKWGIEKINCLGEDMIQCYNTESPVCDSCMLTSPEWFCAEGEKKK